MTPTFDARVVATFAALGGAADAQPWQLSRAIEACVGAAHSSEEEEAGSEGEAARWRDACDNSDDDELPTRAFCAALDHEEEEDDIDRLAIGRDVDASRPDRSMSAPLDSVYERHALRNESVVLYELDEPITIGQPAEETAVLPESGAAWRLADGLVSAASHAQPASRPLPVNVNFAQRSEQRKRKAPSGTGLSSCLGEEDDGADDADAMPPTQKRARQLRKRTDIEE
jgi:hypothetical protein